MFRVLMERFRQGYRTLPFPARESSLPERFRGMPVVDSLRCAGDCFDCAAVCPSGAILRSGRSMLLDLGKCVFCSSCSAACGRNGVHFSRDYRLAAFSREALILGKEGVLSEGGVARKEIKRVFGRSLKLRQISAGGCNACEADVNVLNTLAYDLGRFGIQFAASPRHADGLLVTGPVSVNMRSALLETYAAIPEPRIVIACGACAISGGIYNGHPETCGGVSSILSVDLFIPGCPPHPYTILDGLLRLIGRIK